MVFKDGLDDVRRAHSFVLCRFMRFMERYAEENDLGFTKKQVGVCRSPRREICIVEDGDACRLFFFQ